MDPLTAARAQMEVSLGFHMLFAALGVGLPLLLVIAEGIWLRTKRADYRELARTWGKATAVLFAIGAVSGTALSFELGLLWPRFMAFSGEMIGPTFALEGFAFFVEAIFIGLYLYGWDKLSPLHHWLTGIPVAISGATSSVLVVAANAWMQVPSGFRLDGLQATDIRATAAFESPVWPIMSLHSTLACYVATGFAVAGVYAAAELRRRKRGDAPHHRSAEYHRRAMDLALAVAAVAAVLQIVTGDRSAKAVAIYEPVKLAAMESHFDTVTGAPLTIGGWPDMDRGEVRVGLAIPKALSFLATGDPDAEVRGLRDLAPREDWPSVPIAHVSFQIMVASGFALVALGAWYWIARWRRRAEPRREGRALLWALAIGSPLGFLALEAGWIVTEVGRQPWVVAGVMRTRDAVTPAAHVPMTFVGFTLLYLALGITLAFLLRSLARPTPEAARA